MGKLTFDITVSLDGFITGPNPGQEHPLGEGGERLHEWAYGLASWREPHGLEGGERNADSDVLEEAFARSGAIVMGRKMFGGPPDEGPWGDDPGDGWWGDEPPFGVPVFVLTHHPRDTVQKQGDNSFTFVTDGIERALTQAREAAGDRDVSIAGGADVIQQYLRAGLVDDFQLHVVPLLLGEGTRLFAGLGPDLPDVEAGRVVHSPSVTHLAYRVVR